MTTTMSDRGPTTAPGTIARPHRRATSARRRDAATGLLFVAPQVLGVALFVLLPVAMTVRYALSEWNVFNGQIDFVGTGNFQAMASDAKLGPVLGATAVFSLGIVVLNLSLGLGLAVLLNRRLRGVTFFRTLFFSPVVVSVVAWALVWGFLLQDNGAINGVLAAFGIDGPNWLNSGGTAMASVVVTQVLRSVGTNMVLFLAALQGVPPELLEAAKLDGASARRAFTSVVMPLISPTILLTAIITIVGALQAFAQIAVLTQGGPGVATNVLVYYVYQVAFSFNDIGYGSALALILLALVMVLTLVQWQLRRKWVFYEN
jgi:ABC-type sugar transport system permease subunit